MPIDIIINSVIAGILASLACGMGALPLALPGLDLKKHRGVGFSLAAGLMMSASVYNLLLPGLTLNSHELPTQSILMVVGGIFAGALFLALTERWMHGKDTSGFEGWGGRRGVLIFIAMCVHSIPEGVAVGVGYAAEPLYNTNLGSYIAVAIALHNIPEGLAVAIPMRAAGATMSRCFWAAVLTSLPQPIAAGPASILSWFFEPLMPLLMGFAAGAMIFLVLLEMIPEALEETSCRAVAWAFTIGFCGMLILQVML